MSEKTHIVALADDDPDDREFFVEVCSMSDINLKILLFENGKQVLDYLDNPHSGLPEILFLDINMPIKNGFETLHEIRSRRKDYEMCIIMYSTSVNEVDLVKSKKLYANAYLQKPANFQRLCAAVTKILETDWDDPCKELEDMDFLIST